MAFYIRRLSKISNWPDKSTEVILNNISADAISELRTSGNNLSWWEIGNEEDAEKMAASLLSTMDMGVGEITIVLIPVSDFTGLKIVQSPEDGKTAILGMKEFHYNMSELNYGSIGEVAKQIANHVAETNGKFVRRFKSKKLIEVLKEMNQNGFLNFEELGKYAKNKLV